MAISATTQHPKNNASNHSHGCTRSSSVTAPTALSPYPHTLPFYTLHVHSSVSGFGTRRSNTRSTKNYRSKGLSAPARLVTTMEQTKKVELPSIEPLQPRWEPKSNPRDIVVPGLDTNASVQDQIEQIEQLITIKLQVRICRMVGFERLDSIDPIRTEH